jgi:hypothetical protein
VGRLAVAAVVAALLAAGSAAAVARADAQPSVFDGAGVFVDNTGNFPGPWTLADELRRDGFSWVALQVNDGLTMQDLDPVWIEVMREHGLAVGGWGAEEQHPLIDAVIAHLQVQRYGLDFYIANAERPYESNQRGGWRSRNFVDVFRYLEPTLPAALVTLGAAPAPYVIPIDWAAWRNAGFQLLPEAYYNKTRVYRPDLTVAHAIRAGWAPEDVHPVIGVWGHYPAASYVPLLQADGAQGFSVFLADQMQPADFDALSGLAHAASAGS